MKIAIGCDEAGFNLKETIKKYVQELGFDVEDYGVFDTKPVLYPDIAYKVATSISTGKHERGILICGTGIGMAITANKIPKVRAAVCHDVYSTERSRKSNDCQIMCLGARVIGDELAKLLVKRWLECDFQGGGSSAKVERIKHIENEFNK
jgi:ribose 5-phosphate isomerase B